MASTPARVSVHDLDGDELAAYIEDHIARWGVPPLAGADGAAEGGEGGEGEGGDDGAGADDAAAAGEGEGGDDKAAGKEPDWKSEARKHERRAKATTKELEQLRKEKAERDAANKTEQEKALEQAREEARNEALSEAAKERRADRLEVAVTRAAAKTFADTDDALTHIERAIARGDVDEDDIFDDAGKVQTEALNTALEELLERKPHLAAEQADDRRFKGGSGAGKGAGSGKELREMSPEDHLKRQQKSRA